MEARGHPDLQTQPHLRRLRVSTRQLKVRGSVIVQLQFENVFGYWGK